MGTYAPIEVLEPLVILLALIFAIFNHFFPKHILPFVKYQLYTNAEMRESFESLYNEYIMTAIQAEVLAGKSSDFAQFSLLRRKLNIIFKQLDKYPKIYWQPYPMTPQTRKLFGLLDSPDGTQITSDRVGAILNRMEFHPLDMILGYIPTVAVFVVYLCLVFIHGFSYELFSWHEGLAVSSGDKSTNPLSVIFFLISWLPSSLFYTLSAASTSFWMLYFVFKTTISHLLPAQ